MVVPGYFEELPHAVCRGAFRKQEEKTGGKKATDKTEDQELEPGNLEEDVVLKDTIQAAAWCQVQSFKDSVSLPEVIGMEGWEQRAASVQRKSHDGGDEEEAWQPFQFSFQLQTDYELFCVEMMDRRNLKVFASFESNTSPPPPSPLPVTPAPHDSSSLMMQHNGGAWQLWRR
ncbi:uncharacterized protein LOC132463593 isoform X2 [Gadus macrocephalus]|uniref:uncharacterized protein LOC132463593 isoform X2 n=1 Tax=Gadus macrocephalus TaxID=80720 RepID=UPI0028CB90C7|nr:uncharacterized protein LOC132463593 isoform X2 [Gadus macrocephalus]